MSSLRSASSTIPRQWLTQFTAPVQRSISTATAAVAVSSRCGTVGNSLRTARPHPQPHRCFSLKQASKELVTGLQNDLNDLTGGEPLPSNEPAIDEEARQYLQEVGWQLEEDRLNDSFVLSRQTPNGTQIIVQYDVQPDDVDEFDKNEAEEPLEGEEQVVDADVQGEEEDAEDQQLHTHSFSVDIRPTGGKSYVRIYAHADPQSALVLNSLNFSQSAVEEADAADNNEDAELPAEYERNDLRFADLLPEVQQAFADWAAELGIDNRLPLFIQNHTFGERTKQHAEKLQKFLQLVKDTSK